MRKLIWLPVVLFVGLTLYSVAAQINWGSHRESGAEMAGVLGYRILGDEGDEAAGASELASEVCGERVTFNRYPRKDEWWAVLPERQEVGYFLIHTQLRSVVWVVLGVDGRQTCAARYELVMRDRGSFTWFPLWPLPYPRWYRIVDLHIEGRRLLDRISRPEVPVGSRSLLPGECVRGKLFPGETIRYQAKVPKFGQEVHIASDWDWPGGEFVQASLTKDGHEMRSNWEGDVEECGRWVDKDGGGTYDILIHNQTNVSRRYTLRVDWEGARSGCPLADGWWKDWVSPPPGH